jgi:signal transduction histidine kinase
MHRNDDVTLTETSSSPISNLRLTDWRRFVLAMLAAAIVSAAIVASLYIQEVRHQRALMVRDGWYVVALEQEFLAREFRSVQSDLLFLAAQEGLKDFLSGSPLARQRLEQEYSQFARHKGVYDQIRFLDDTGQEIIRVNYRHGEAEVVPSDQLQAKATRYYYQQALSLRPGKIFVSSFDLNVEHGRIEQPIKPVVRFLTPVVDVSGKTRGLLVLNYLGAHLLAKLKEVSAGFPGNTMLINQEGEFLQTANPDHEWGWMRKHEHSFRRYFPEAWRKCRDLNHGQFRIGHDLFTVQRVSPAATPRGLVDPGVIDGAHASSLLLVSHIPDSVRAFHSNKLLTQLLWMTVGTMALAAVLATYWARSAAIRDHQEQRLAASEARLRLLSSRLLAAQETERHHVSRKLHDELGQLVTAISLDLKSATREPAGEHLAHLLKRATDETNQLLKSLHEIASDVRPSVLDDLGLQDAIESFISEYQRRTQISVKCDLRFHPDGIPPKIGENVYRILQEALSNVASHAHADEAFVAIETDARECRMLIRDSGIGFPIEQLQESSRLGILGMRERAELLNGQFTLNSAPGAGTQIRVLIPLNGEAA